MAQQIDVTHIYIYIYIYHTKAERMRSQVSTTAARPEIFLRRNAGLDRVPKFPSDFNEKETLDIRSFRFRAAIRRAKFSATLHGPLHMQRYNVPN